MNSAGSCENERRNVDLLTELCSDWMCTAICQGVRNLRCLSEEYASATHLVIDITKRLQRSLISIKCDTLHTMLERQVLQLDLDVPGSRSLRWCRCGIYHVMKHNGVWRHEKPSYNLRQLGKIHGFCTQKLRKSVSAL